MDSIIQKQLKANSFQLVIFRSYFYPNQYLPEIILSQDLEQVNRPIGMFCQFYIMLNTIFCDNKINEFPHIQSNNFKDVTIFGLKQLRSSHSPQKVRTSKKFYYSIRNKSIKKLQDQASAHQDLQKLIRKEKIILMAQRTSLNDLILPAPDIHAKEAELMALPTIDIRKVSETDAKSNTVRKKVQKRGLIDIIDCKGGYQSNILRSKKDEYETITTTNINWPGNKQNPEQKYPKKINPGSIPKIVSKRNSSQIQQKCQSPNSKASQVYSPSKIKEVKSTFKFDEKVSFQKRFKKGYLSYEAHGHQKWQRIKKGIQKQALIKIDNPSKLISAKIFYVYDADQDQPILAHSQSRQIQIASLSKIMTCYLSILICLKYEVDLKNCYYRVPDKISETPGTSAELSAGDLLNVEDLLYGLMLPSGNDASICLAELMGKIIQRHKKKQQKNSYFQTFMVQMNAFSKQLDLNQKWGNSSGLPNNPNFSTAQAITALSALATQNDLFRKIVTTKQIELDIKNDRYGLVIKKSWKNTNKLLEKGWQGVKTGTTQTAGHCLISKREKLIISVFDCQTVTKRFTDSIRLYEYISKIRQKT